MKKILRYLLWFTGGLVALGGIAFLLVHEKRPVGTPGAEAEAMTQRIYEAINKTAWDSTAWIKWTYKGGHHLVWDRRHGKAHVSWDDKKVKLDLHTLSGTAFRNNELLDGEASKKVLEEGWRWFYNDSYWLVAPSKLTDPGTTRSVVDLGNGQKGLLVTYASGGTTPGDTYLWTTDTSGLPVQYKMWVKIIPIGGVTGTWENWVTLPTGAKIATRHIIGGRVTLEIADLEAGMGDLTAF